MAKNGRILLIYLPPYLPDLNPIERLWRWLKETIIAIGFIRHVLQLKKR
ncbi:transposase [Geobacillus thermodenitrificans]